MNTVIDRQASVDLFSIREGIHLQHKRQDHVLPSMDKVHEFFQKQTSFDTVKLCHEGKKSYVHFDLDDVKVFDSKKALRKTLSRENGGAWVEEKSGKKRYFIDDSGWFDTSFKQVSKDEFLERLDSPSTIQKIVGIGIGILALAPGVSEFARHIPIQATAPALIGMGHKSSFLGLLACTLFPSQVDAQAIGTEFQVNNFTIDSQSSPKVASLNNGQFLVTWTSLDQDGDGQGVFGQRYNENGLKIREEFQINTYNISNQAGGSISALTTGGFVVTWQSNGQDGDLQGAFGQRYNENGDKLGEEFQINTYTPNDQRSPQVVALPDGGFVAVWPSSGQEQGSTYGIFGQRFDENGTKVGLEFQINSHTQENQSGPNVASLADGGFVVTWTSFRQDGDGFGVFGQRYDANVVPVGLEFQANTHTPDDQSSGGVTGLTGGGYVVVWQSDLQDGSSIGIFGQKYAVNGSTSGSEFQANNYTLNYQWNPCVVGLNDGGYVVFWGSNGQDGDSVGIFGQRYNSGGLLTGGEFQVNNYTVGSQDHPAAASLSDGGFVVIWRSNGQDGDQDGIFGKKYDVNGNAVGPSTITSSSMSVGLTLTSSPSNTNSLTSMEPSNSEPSITSASISISQLTTMDTVSSELSSVNTSTRLSSFTSSNGESSQSTSSTVQTSSDLRSATGSLAPSTVSVQPTPNGSVTTPQVTSLSTVTQNPTTEELVTSTEISTGISLIDIEYNQNYPITLNGNNIGTFTLTGGDGPYSIDNSNFIGIEFAPGYTPQDGDTFTLFTLPEEEEVRWEDITLTGEGDCLIAEGELATPSQTGTEGRFQVTVSKSGTTCTVGASKFSAIPLLASGSLV